jgi:glucose uptake protein
MYIPETFGASIVLMVLSMLCWGSWANTFSLCRGKYRFELFYWDYAVGVVLGSLAFYAALGPGLGGLAQLAFGANAAWAVFSGVVFNIGNVLLVAAISMTGMAVAFPISIGLALLIGVGVSWAISPAITALPLAAGSVFLLISMGLDAAAYRAMAQQVVVSTRGIAIAVVGGVFMGAFPPCLQKALVGPGALDSYAAGLMLAVGVLLCTVATNWFYMRRPIAGGAPVGFRDYARATAIQHVLGLLGGAVWAAGMVFNSIAGGKVSVAISYAFGTGGTLVAALWGVLVWKEFRGAPKKSYLYLLGMFATFAAGIAVLAYAKATAS